MSYLKKMFGRGGGGSGSASAPTNTPDTLRSKDTVEFILGLGQGPFYGLKDGVKSYYVGDTQLMNDDGTYNFTPFSLTVYRGSPAGETITPLLGGAAASSTVGVTLFHNTGVVRQTTIRNVDQINLRLEISALWQSNDKGSFTEDLSWRVEYKATQSAIWINPYGKDITITDKTTSAYIKEMSFKVPNISDDDYDVRVTKLSIEDDGTGKFSRVIAWESFQVIKTGSLSFPNVACVQGVGEASDNFSSLPDFSGVFYTKIVNVPSNYDAVNRTYNGTWDGTWKKAYTNNAALVFNDYVNDPNGGLAAYYNINLDKYDVYDAAQWCDVLIKKNPDDPNEVGKPRYTCNLTVSDARSGKELATYLAGVFNAVFYDDLDGGARLIIDKDDPATHLITKTDIIGEFSYSYTDVSSRYNDITVTFINPELNWQEDRRRVYDQDDIDKNGRVPLDFVAVGCIDPDEAVRRGRYKLLTALTENQSLTITRNRMAEYMQPFEIALIADENMGYAVGGRMRDLAEDGLSISLRDSIFLENGISYVIRFQVPNPDYLVDGSATGGDPYTVIYRNIVNTTRGAVKVLQFDTPIAAGTLPDFASFSLEQPGGGLGLPKPFRVLSITDGQDSETYTVNLVEMNRNKTSGADGYSTGVEPIYSYKSPDLSPPTNLQLNEVIYYVNGLPASFINGTFTPSKFDPGNVVDADGNTVTSLSDNHAIVAYRVSYVTPAGNLVTMAPIADNEFEIKPALAGTYTVNVQGLSVDGRASASLTGTIECHGKVGLPTTPQNLKATGAWREIDLAWDAVPDTDNNGYNVYENTVDNFASASKYDHAASPWYPRKNLETGDARFFWVTAIDFAGNESLPSNSAYAVTSFVVPVELMGKAAIDQSLLVPELQEPIAAVPNLVDAILQATGHAASALASVNVETTIRQTKDQSLAEQITNVEAIFNGAIGLVRVDLQTEVDAREAMASEITDLQTYFSGFYAGIEDKYTVLSSAQQLSAEHITTLQTDNINTKSSVQELESSVNGITAEWTIKTEVDANGVRYVAGAGEVTTLDDKGQPTSEFTIISEKFVVAHLLPDGTIAKGTPFFIGPDPTYSGTGSAPEVILLGGDGSTVYAGKMDLNQLVSVGEITSTLEVRPGASGGGFQFYNSSGTLVLGNDGLSDSVVGTATLQFNAATLPMFAEISTIFTGNGSYQSISTMSPDYTHEASVKIDVNWMMDFTGDNTGDALRWDAKLIIDGTTVIERPSRRFITNTTISYVTTLPAGSHDIEFWWAGHNGGGSVIQAELFSIAVWGTYR